MGWKVTSVSAPRFDGAAAIAIVETDDGAIPVGGATTEEAAHRAHLVSAAPDLLVAAIRVRARCQSMRFDDDASNALNDLSAAIAKATEVTTP